MTFKQMTDDVVHLLGLSLKPSNDESVFAKRFLNEGVVDILARCRPSNQIMQLGLVASTIVHQLDPSVIALKDILYPGYGFLDRLSREDVMRAQQAGDPTSESYTGASCYGFAYLEPLLWVSPIPSQNMYIEAHGTFRPAPMAADTDDPSQMTFGALAPEFHMAVERYALWRTADLIQHQLSSFGERWRLLYEGQDGNSGDISRIKKIVQKRSTPQGTRRRDLTASLGALSDSGAYTGGWSQDW
jgi:hypothetical protein